MLSSTSSVGNEAILPIYTIEVVKISHKKHLIAIT